LPRRKTKGPTQELDAVLPQSVPLALPPGRPMHPHERPIDPYESAPGAVILTREPIKRPLTRAEMAERDERREEQKIRATRYLRFLDALHDNGGDEATALAIAYDRTPEAVALNFYELLEDVRAGLGSTSLANVLEHNDLSQAARIRLFRKHAYSENPAASLKALQLVGELEGGRGDHVGSFESTLRMAKEQA